MKPQNIRAVQENIFIIYILSLLGLIITLVCLNGMGVNRNSTTTETLLTPIIPFTIPKQAEKLTPKENPVLELQPKAYLLQL